MTHWWQAPNLVPLAVILAFAVIVGAQGRRITALEARVAVLEGESHALLSPGWAPGVEHDCRPDLVGQQWCTDGAECACWHSDAAPDTPEDPKRGA